MKQFLSFSCVLFLISISVGATGFNFRYVQSEFMTPDHIEATVKFDDTLVDCMIDTGARFTVAKESLLPNNIKVGERRGGGVSGIESVTELVESKVQIGDWINSNSIIGRKKNDQLPAQCLLGNDFFLEKEFSIDFKDNKISDETSFLGTEYPLQQFKSDIGGHFGFTIDIQGEQISTLFDTGATDTVFDLSFVETHPENFEFIKELPVLDGSNQTIKAGIYKMKSVRFGSIEEKDVQVFVLSLKNLQAKIPGIQAIIGLNQMMNHKWYINNKKSVWGIY